MTHCTAPVMNPWGFSLAVVDALDAMCEKGTSVAAGDRLGITNFTINQHLKDAQIRMQADTRLKAILLWDRWRQGEGKAVPA
jgi:hypothetical protein